MNRGVQVLLGSKVIEVRQTGVNKGAAARRWLDNQPGHYDFILATGDDRTDEELFQVLPDYAWSIEVAGGVGTSAARFQVESYDVMLALLNELVESSVNTRMTGAVAAGPPGA
jgi:trehalose 6-phosphate synthase/phosphatase